MTDPLYRHRLDGLEPDNLLAFLALLGLLRALETARTEWFPRAVWDLDNPPLRPVLVTSEGATREAVCEAAAEGVATLCAAIDFGTVDDLKIARQAARELLCHAAAVAATPADQLFAELCTALLSDAALARDGSGTAPSPLTYPKVARINFLESLKVLSGAPLPERRARDPKYPRRPADCIEQALFQPWQRLDRPAGLRWDAEEAKRHAYQWNAPTAEAPRTQHGANRLAVIGLPALTGVPAFSGADIRLTIAGGKYERDGGFSLAWPVWRPPASLAAIRALLLHPLLREPNALTHLGVDYVLVARRISLDRYRNYTYAEPLQVRI